MPRGALRRVAFGSVVYRVVWLEGRIFINGDRVRSIIDTDARTITLQRGLTGEQLEQAFARMIGHLLETHFQEVGGLRGVLCEA